MTAGNASDSRNQNANRSSSKPNVGKSGNSDNQQRGDKARAYVADEKNGEEQLEKDFPEPEKYEDYHANDENLNYYDPDNYVDDGNEMPVNFTSPIVAKASQFRCRRCRKAFPSNNALHKHLRNECTAVAAAVAYPAVASSTGATKATSVDDQPPPVSSEPEATVIRSNAESASSLGTGYGFRGWNYTKTQVSLALKTSPKDVCLDTDAEVTLADRLFYKKQVPDGVIRTMATPLKVRGLDTQRHESYEYAICDIHMKGTKNGKPVTSVLRREVHLINNLKANMLINNDVIDAEGIVVDPVKKKTFITSTDAAVPVEVRSPKASIQRPVHIRKTTVVPPRSEIAVPIHHAVLPTTRDFLFEPADDVNFTLYAHLVDTSTSAVIIRNDRDQPIQIPRNFRLERITELDFPNTFQVSANEADDVKHLTAKEPKSTHKDGWFKKLVAACATAYAAASAVNSGIASSAVANPKDSSVASLVMPSTSAASYGSPPPPQISAGLPESQPNELVLPNGVTIHQSAAADSFAKIVDEFPTLWHDTDFADVPEEN